MTVLWTSDGRLPKELTAPQQNKLPVPDWHERSLCTGFTKAVMPLAKAMVVTKEMRGKWNSIVKNVV